MPDIIAAAADSLHLQTVKALWRAHSNTLGFLPEGAFLDYARQRHLLVSLNHTGHCVGYLLFRETKDKATIVHLCIADDARGQGHAQALVRRLIDMTRHLRGIGLRCRRDFPAYSFWPKLAFAAISEAPGRAAKGSQTTYFWLDHGHPNLFTQEVAAVDAVIDSNVFVDLVDSRNEESLGLLADWLEDSIRLCITPEHYNEFDRSPDSGLRLRRRVQAASYHCLDCAPDEYRKAETLLKPLFQTLGSLQDQSDFRHLVRAIAGGADVFVTRDEPMLDRTDEVYASCGLSIVRPSELIGRIDELLREREYQRFQVAGTRHISRRRTSTADDALIDAIRGSNEAKRRLRAELQPLLANPQRFSCFVVTDSDEQVLAFYVLERQQRLDQIPYLRICSNRLAGTLARSILTGVTHQAARDGKLGVLLTEPVLTDDLRAACTDLGFLSIQIGRLKLVVSGVHSASSLAGKVSEIQIEDSAIRQVMDVLRTPFDARVASELEHLLWPAKITHTDLPTFVVAIRPEYAQHLFDEGLAKQSLFGADVELALNPESVYYRSASQRIITAPGRVLWYVSGKGKFAGTMAIRACSRVVEVCVGKPKHLFKRFQRLGVYEWSDVLNTAKGDFARDIMAVRFDDTERIGPLKWENFQPILKRYGIRTSLESPARIPQAAFNEIYTLAVGASPLCQLDT